MGLKRKKGKQGVAASFITRGAALRKLQVGLPEFRRLCILKGIFPRDPKRKLEGTNKTYYAAKDIRYILHEPLLRKFRQISAHKKKINRAIARREKSIARALEDRTPAYALYHLVKERYPTLLDCVKDLDDALSTVALFASLPSNEKIGVPAEVVAESVAQLDTFMLWASRERLLRKVFCSIKGFYFQLKYLGQNILFLLPHQFPQDLPEDVDFKILLTFLEFYNCLVKSFNFKVFKLHNLQFPPTANAALVHAGARFAALSAVELGEAKLDASVAADATENEDTEVAAEAQRDFGENETWKALAEASAADEKVRNLFAGKKFFLGREIPKVPLLFALISCGAELVQWQDNPIGIKEDDHSITHHVMDRPAIPASLESFEGTREFLQPQWVFDSINESVCLPLAPYRPGLPPPPHLSPFVDDEGVGYLPEQRLVLQRISAATKEKAVAAEDGIDGEDVDGEDKDIDEAREEEQEHIIDLEVERKTLEPAVEVKKAEKAASRKLQKEIEQKEIRKTLLSARKKRIYDRMENRLKSSSEKVARLHEKRQKAKKAV